MVVMLQIAPGIQTEPGDDSSPCETCPESPGPCPTAVHNKTIAYITVREACVDGLVNEDSGMVAVPAVLGFGQGQIRVDGVGSVLVKDRKLAAAARPSRHPQHNCQEAVEGHGSVGWADMVWNRGSLPRCILRLSS